MADLFTPIAHVEELKANIQAAVCSITNMLKGTWVLDICRPTSVAHTEIDCDKWSYKNENNIYNNPNKHVSYYTSFSIINIYKLGKNVEHYFVHFGANYGYFI